MTDRDAPGATWMKCTVAAPPPQLETLALELMELGSGGVEEIEGGLVVYFAPDRQAAVETHGWLAPGEMLDGLGLAETTPGPLIMVTQFVGFMGAFRDPGTLPPVLAALMPSASACSEDLQPTPK